MNGEWVTLNLDDDIECKIWVGCDSSTPNDVLERLAIDKLHNSLPKKKTGLAAAMDALETISDYEYSMGLGRRYEIEQELKRRFAEMREK
jgi:hypothetical protein